MKKLSVISHPLITHNLSVMREFDTPVVEFRRRRLEYICKLMFYEATKDLPTKKTEVTTPLEAMSTLTLDCELAIISILRAGLGMQVPLLDLHPEAKVGHLGFYRDESTLKPIQYYFNLPQKLETSITFLVDPMLATGGSLDAALTLLKEHGAAKIKCLVLVSAQDGVDFVFENHPEIEIYTAALDRGLNEKGYILPGLGDAGDRMFST